MTFNEEPTGPPRDLQEHLTRLHSEGLIDIDRPLRDFLSPAGLHIQIPEPEGGVRTMVWVYPTIFGDADYVPVETLTDSMQEIRSRLEDLQRELRDAIDRGSP